MIIARLENYSQHEITCSCGCGLLLTQKAAITFQAFIWVLERMVGGKVRHCVTGSVRCQKHHLAVYEKVNADRKEKGLEPKTAPKGSRHLPPALDALDGRYEREADGKWMPIPLEFVAEVAIKSGLFGGVGVTEYQNDGRNIIHLDTRPGPVETW